MRPVVCAVDVGTGSARAGIFDMTGELLGRAEAPIEMRRPRPGHAEHNSEQIWAAVCQAVRAAREQAGVSAGAVQGIGFDATCSLVVRAANGVQLPVYPDGNERWDTIAWFDHRALEEADICTATGHAALADVGGIMSPEMQIPKLMWLKRHVPEVWNAAGAIYDLADFLTFRASGSPVRSQNTLACKWLYRPQEDDPWALDFLAAIDLGEMTERCGISEPPAAMGAALGRLLPEAADALGLTVDCKVGAGLVDAYAGALAVLGGLSAEELGARAALIAGTSSCVMFADIAPRHLPAVWGPFRDAALSGYWMSEAGQSAAGALLDHVVRLHGLEADADTHRRIALRIAELRRQEGVGFAAEIHVLPDFHGNRAPFGDPHALGVIHGLSLDSSFDSLCRLYWRSCVGIALGIRHIVETLREAGRPVDALYVAGGHLKSPLLMELYADAVGCRIVEPASHEAVLLGTAMVAAATAGLHPDLTAAARAMSRPGIQRQCNPAAKAYYDRDYRIFLEMHGHRQAIEALTKGV